MAVPGSHPVRQFRTEVGKHRLHDLIANFLVFNAVTTACGYMMKNQQMIPLIDGRSDAGSKQFQLLIQMPVSAPLQLALKSQIPSAIEINAYHHIEDPLHHLHPDRYTGFAKVSIAYMRAIFVQFYEDHKQWLYDNVDRDDAKWPRF
jgi:hypothetical protein